jgi:hypothetical protein
MKKKLSFTEKYFNDGLVFVCLIYLVSSLVPVPIILLNCNLNSDFFSIIAYISIFLVFPFVFFLFIYVVAVIFRSFYFFFKRGAL